MIKNCPYCNTALPENWQFPRCPYCGKELPAEEPANTGFSMGDANAISGGVHIDSHNVSTTNITNIERDKTNEELEQEKIVKYKQLCQQVYADGRIDPHEAKQMEDMRLTLGLDEETALNIQEQVRKNRLQQSSNNLNPIVKVTINQVISLAKSDKTDMLRLSISRLESLANKYNVEEVQFYYYLILSALEPQKCISDYTNRTTDNYWQAFWTYIAYLNTNQIGEAEEILANMEIFDNQPYGNITLLAATSSLYQYWSNVDMSDYLEQAKMFLEQGSIDHSEILDRFTQVLMLIIENDDDDSIQEFQKEFSFYFNHIFNVVMEKKKIANIRKMIPPIPKIAPLPH